MPAYFKSNFSLFQGTIFPYQRKQSTLHCSHHLLLHLFIDPTYPSLSLGHLVGCECGGESMLTGLVQWIVHYHTFFAFLQLSLLREVPCSIYCVLNCINIDNVIDIFKEVRIRLMKFPEFIFCPHSHASDPQQYLCCPSFVVS